MVGECVEAIAVHTYKSLGYDAESAKPVARELEALGRKGQVHTLIVADKMRKKVESGTLLARILDSHFAPVATVRFLQTVEGFAGLVENLDVDQLRRVVAFLEAEFSPSEQVNLWELEAVLAVVI